MPLTKEEAEARDREEENKGREGYNRWGNKINPELEPCPGPICDMHARYVPRAESAPSQEEEKEPSGLLGKLLGKAGGLVDEIKEKGGVGAAVVNGANKALNFLYQKERDIIRGAKRGLRRVLGIKSGPRPPIADMTDAQKILYEEFKKFMETAPTFKSLEDAMDDAAREERELLEWACMDATGKTCAQMNRDAEAETGFKFPEDAR